MDISYEGMNQRSSTGPDRRIIVKQVILENFKSYYGKKIIGPFNKVEANVINRILMESLDQTGQVKAIS